MEKTTRSESSNLSQRPLSSRDLRGLFLPITTPFTSDGAVDLPALKSNIAKWNQTGISGYVILGSTGERVHLEEREYVEVIETARAAVADTANGKLAFIVGAGQQSTRGTINEIKKVAAFAADASFLVITPHFYRPAITQPALIAHYQRVADESPASLILYSMPPFTGIRIDPDTAARLSEHENIIGIKDSSADVELLAETIKLAGEDFAVLTGNGTVLLPALQAGATGAILAVGCVVPEVCIEILRAVGEGETKRASKLQEKLTPLATAVTTRFGIGGLKAALDMCGYKGGTVRDPLPSPDSAAGTEIEELLRAAEQALQASPASSAVLSG